MAQPTPATANGVSSPDASDHSSQLSVPGKRKRDSMDRDDVAPAEQPAKPDASNTWAAKNPLELIKCYYDVVQRYVVLFSEWNPADDCLCCKLFAALNR